MNEDFRKDFYFSWFDFVSTGKNKDFKRTTIRLHRNNV